MSLSEAQIEKKVCDYVKSKGGIGYKFVSPARRSVPDRMIALPNGVLFFIEFKKPGGRLTSGQEREIKRLRDLGQRVYVIDDVEDGKQTVGIEAYDIYA
jgi:hypothetical protein